MSKKHKLLNVCIFSSLTVLSIAGINKFIFATSTMKEILSKKRCHTYDWRFGKIYYTKQGNGTPLLLIHDLIPGSSDFEWNQLVKELSRTHTVYTMDLLGYGRSDKPAMTYTNYLYVQLITDFIKTVIGRRCDVITSGSSSSIAVMACRMDTSLFNKMMFISPVSLYETSLIPNKYTKSFKFLLELPVIGTFAYNLMAAKYRIRADFEEKYFTDPIHITTNLVEAYYEAAHLHGSNSRYVFSSLKGNYINFSITHALSAIDNSMYVIQGADTLGHKEITMDYQQQNASIEATTIFHAKHFPQIENPAELLEHCRIFLG